MEMLAGLRDTDNFEEAVPSGLVVGVRGRLRSLQPGTLRFLQMGAVLGGRFGFHDAAALCGQPSASLIDALDALITTALFAFLFALTHPSRRPCCSSSLSAMSPPASPAEPSSEVSQVAQGRPTGGSARREPTLCTEGQQQPMGRPSVDTTTVISPSILLNVASHHTDVPRATDPHQPKRSR
ncbi:hypothetical protein [Streptomyces sp. S.PB5]|uniref:hypothetical protein n=1 Tax=Streptomyces sp. S.PB5 TaxID=3020844 RepID=UPI0025B24997|nr:hypothetical protein [Streptomyces sp. S.PB5]MDN3027204.1 hypothetical protein [Streptomyces sp. S.PB5]